MDKKLQLEDAWSNLFAGSSSATGEEELLRMASGFSMQLTARQIKAILFLEWLSQGCTQDIHNSLVVLVERWLKLKANNNSDVFIMKALEMISLRKFLNENSFKVDIAK